jgi:hypothetical protein
MRKEREKVVAEITLRHLIEVVKDAGIDLSRDEGKLFLNNGGHANEMWKRMMEAGSNYAVNTLLDRRTSQRAWALAHRRTS